MSKPLFWLDWPLSYRILYSLMLAVFFAVLAYTGYCYWVGNAAVIQWDVKPELEVATLGIDTFSKHFFDFTVTADAYVLVEKFMAADMKFNVPAYYIHLCLSVLGLLLILCAISDLSISYYGIGLAIIALFVSGMNLEAMRIRHDLDEHLLTIATLGSYASASLIFRSFWPQASYLMRFITYSAITGVLAWVISTYSLVENPVIHLTNHGYAMPMILVLAFMLFNAHEIIRGLLFIASKGSVNNRMRQFWFLSLLYFANILYVFAKTNWNYDLDIYYLPAVPIFIITGFIGIWGLRHRAEQLQEFVAFAPTGSFLYLGTGIISFSGLAFAMATANDSHRQVIEDGILYSHATMAVSFMAYIYFNFKDLIAQGHSTDKILYKPLLLPFLYVFIFGTAMAIGLQFKNGFSLYQKALSGYYIGLGDTDWMAGEKYTAKQFYSFAQAYDPLCHRSFYALGSMAKQEKQNDAAYLFFKDGQDRNPSPQGYAVLSFLKEKSEFSFETLFELEQGLRRFPTSAELLNNKALLLNKTSLADSAFLYLMLAKQQGQQREIIESNLYSLWTKYSFPNIDSVIEDWEPMPYIGTASNELAFLTKIGRVSDKPLNRDYLTNDVLDTKQLCYLYNYMLNHANQPDTALLSHIRHLSKQVANEQFDLYLYFIMGHGLYKQGQFREAFQFLKAAKDEAGMADGHFPNMMGLRLLEHEKYRLAAKQFEIAWLRSNENALLNLAIATSEFDRNEAIALWEKVRSAGKEDWTAAANDMLLLLPTDATNLPLENADPQYDLLRYRYLHYQRDLPHARFMQLANLIATPVFHASILSERAQMLTDRGEFLLASECIKAIASKVLNEETEPYLEMAYLKWQYAQGQFNDEFKARADIAAYPAIHKGKRAFYLGAYWAAKRDFAQAEAFYRQAMEQLPFDDAPFLAMFEAQLAQKKGEEAYQTLLNGIFTYPESEKLYKQYTLTCLELHYDSYAQDAMTVLQTLLPVADYKAFEAVYSAKKAEMEKVGDVWE